MSEPTPTTVGALADFARRHPDPVAAFASVLPAAAELLGGDPVTVEFVRLLGAMLAELTAEECTNG